MATHIHWTNPVSGNFSTAADWTGGAAPTSAQDAYLDAAGAPYTVTSTANTTVNGIDTSANATLAVGSFTTFTAANGTDGGVNAGRIAVGNGAAFAFGGAMNNTGQIALNSANNGTFLEIGAAGATLSGAGAVTLSDNSQNQIIAAAAGTTTLTNIDNTLSGAGYIGRNGGGNLILVNQAKGVIDATGTTNALILDASSGPLANAGLIEATGKGGLVLQAGIFANTGQIKDAGAGALTVVNATIDDSGGGTLGLGASLVLQNGAVLGGTLTLAAGQAITVNAFSAGDLATTSLTNQGAITVQNGGNLTVQDAVTNTGAISVGSANNGTFLTIGGAGATLSGGGTITLSDNAQNTITDAQTGIATLTNIDNTISGAGYIGRFGGSNLILVNQAKGVIDATGTTSALTLDASSGSVANAGLIEATGKGGLTLQAGTFANTGQIKDAGSGAFAIVNATIDDSSGGTLSLGANLVLQNATVLGGTLSVASGQMITVNAFSAANLATTAFTNQGSVTIQNGGNLTVQDAVTNAGAIFVGSAGNGTFLTVGGPGATLSGAGTVTLSDNAQNTVTAAAAGTTTLVNVDNTISGAGYIGRFGGSNLILVNQAKGVIDATGTTNALTLDASSGVATNAGLIESTGKGGLVLQGGTFANTGQITDIGSGALVLVSATVDDSKGGTLTPVGNVVLQNATVVGGSLTLAAATTVNAFSAANLATATLTNQGAIIVQNGGNLTLQNVVTNAGSIAIDSANNGTFLTIGAAGATLSGAGTVTLSDNSQNTVTAAAAGTTTLVNIDNTISGAGYIGRFGGSNLILVNQSKGVIDATGTTNALILDLSSGPDTSAGLIEATGAAGLVIQNGTLNGAGGEIFAGSGSTVTVQATTIVGGGLDTAAGGLITIGNGSSATVDGTLTNAGVIALASTGATTSLIFDKNSTLTGGGTVSLSANAKNYVRGTKGSVFLTNLDNTITGSGQLGGGKLTLVNDAAGVIDANGKTLTINTGLNTIGNAGLIETTGKGVGVVKSAVANTGVIEANGGTLTLEAAVTGAGVTIAAGTLDITNVGAAETVSFTGKTGKLELDQSQSYSGSVAGFSLTGKTSLDLRDITFDGTTTVGYSGTATSGTLTVTHGAQVAHITLVGNYLSSVFTLSSDGKGGTTVVDPQKAAAATAPAHGFVAAMAGLGAAPATAAHASPEVWRPPAAALTTPRPGHA